MRVPEKTLRSAEDQVLQRGRAGLVLRIGAESRAIQQLVEDGTIYQEIEDGDHYKYTHPDIVDRKRKQK